MFKWLGRNQSQKTLDEVTLWINQGEENIKKIREPLGFILMKLFIPLPPVYGGDVKEKFRTKLYFLRVMLPKNTARILGGNIFKKTDLIEGRSGKSEEYYTHKLLCGFIHMISQIQGKRSATNPNVFEVNEHSADFKIFKGFDELILRIFNSHETYALNPNWDYIDNINPKSPMNDWINYGSH